MLVAAVALVLLFQLPGTAAVHSAGRLAALSAQLGQALAEQDLNAGAGGLRDIPVALDGELRRLAAELERLGLAAPALAGFGSAWLETRARLADGATAAAQLRLRLAGQSAAAGGLAAQVSQILDQRQRSLQLALKGLIGALLLLLLLPILRLRRQQRQLRDSLQHASSELGSGAWQDAVRSLREDRQGAPSTFDALATGIEGALGESERRWQALADLSADWYWETDAGHALNWLSGSVPMITIQGWQPKDMLGKRCDQIAFYEAPAAGWDGFHALLARNQPFRDLEHRVADPLRRHWVWVSISGRPRHDAEGRWIGYEGVGREITQRKSAHEKLVASEQRLSLMAGLAADWYWQTDVEHRLLPLTPEYARRFGEHADRHVGSTRWEAFRQALPPAAWDEHRADLEARMPFRSLQYEFELLPGQFIWVSLSGMPRFDGSGRFLGYHGVGRDVTLRKQAERLLLRHNEELQRAVAERTRELEQVNLDLEAFARQLAHELRTPIGHVQGLAHLLEARSRDRLDDEDRHLLGLQVQAAHHMRDTVDALMQLARSTMQPMTMEPVDLSALAQAVVAELPALKRQEPVAWEIQPDLRALAAPAAMRIVLANLLGNAAKFTRHRSRPAVRMTGARDPDGRLRIRVVDNGAGFDAAEAGRLFQPFHRLHTGEDFHGTGIGLTIVQRIVERHGGSVSALGEIGQGARFEFTLAAAPNRIDTTPKGTAVSA